MFTIATCFLAANAALAASLNALQRPLNPEHDAPVQDQVTNVGHVAFSGITTYGLLPHEPCLDRPNAEYDIGIIGIPFDVGVSYRPGARFGPNAIRQASRHLTLAGGYNVPQRVNPFRFWGQALDCGDIAVTPYDKHLALQQIEDAYDRLLDRKTYTAAASDAASAQRTIPRLLSLGGDHTILLPILRSINKIYGPIAVIHFDSHLDSWNPSLSAPSKEATVTHGSFFWLAGQEGLISNDSNIHAGLRTTLGSLGDYEDDDTCGFARIEARDIDEIGVKGIINKIVNRIGTERPVYLSFDIDTLDPAFAPATGTPETGGWTTREMRAIVRGLSKLNLIGADVVELAPAYDTNAEVTAIAAADLLYEMMSIFVRKGPLKL
ncbi:hypothetical protein CkaCkLH20_08671 [Colletotrichum karsti]|uniref:Agmatinase n=1 Tax=Colletotrichum karsti TaxID=1095194 RepID=A0A9P6I182_9PEZI|nr:uncharacterized protein CkaCkLH20_08671 [Colletotrichum karsti]KAF9873937.1 hypothetical protein CkaCkLH20_08671 [Colletotrichum karsti]